MLRAFLVKQISVAMLALTERGQLERILETEGMRRRLHYALTEHVPGSGSPMPLEHMCALLQELGQDVEISVGRPVMHAAADPGNPGTFVAVRSQDSVTSIKLPGVMYDPA